MYKIIYTKKAMKALYKYDRIFKDAVETQIYKFLNQEKVSNIKKLKWYENRYRLRIWKYRVLFEKIWG